MFDSEWMEKLKKAKEQCRRVIPGLDEYIKKHFVKKEVCYDDKIDYLDECLQESSEYSAKPPSNALLQPSGSSKNSVFRRDKKKAVKKEEAFREDSFVGKASASMPSLDVQDSMSVPDFKYESKLSERLKHLEDTFSEYLMYLIEDKDLKNSDVYKDALVDKKIFSKMKNDPDYHPNKLTAMCLCVGAKLNLDESKDLLARAGYAFSPSDMTDVIFSFFIENEIYDMIEIDVQLEEHDLPCIIS